MCTSRFSLTSRSRYRCNRCCIWFGLSVCLVLYYGIWAKSLPRLDIGPVLNLKECIRQHKDTVLLEATAELQGINVTAWGYAIYFLQTPSNEVICAVSIKRCPPKTKRGCYCEERTAYLYKMIVNATAHSFYNNGFLKPYMANFYDVKEVTGLRGTAYPVVTGPTKESLKIGNVLYNKKALKRLNNSRLEISREDITVVLRVTGLTSPFEIKISSLTKSEKRINQTNVSIILNLNSRFVDLHFKEYKHCRRQIVYRFSFLEKELGVVIGRTHSNTGKAIWTNKGRELYVSSVLGLIFTLYLNH